MHYMQTDDALRTQARYPIRLPGALLGSVSEPWLHVADRKQTT